MSTTPSAEASLLDAVAFLEELEQSDGVDWPTPAPELDPRAYDEALEALESGLPTDPHAPQADVPHYERAPIDDPFELPVDQPAPRETRISFMASALVLVACLTAGAATAALVFHDRVTQITALWPATR